jgi:hypothetical protein
MLAAIEHDEWLTYREMHELLIAGPGDDPDRWAQRFADLGELLGCLHRHGVEVFGAVMADRMARFATARERAVRGDGHDRDGNGVSR